MLEEAGWADFDHAADTRDLKLDRQGAFGREEFTTVLFKHIYASVEVIDFNAEVTDTRALAVHCRLC